MPRGQGPGVVYGGQGMIPPGLSRSVEGAATGARNRMVEAMRQKGEAQRFGFEEMGRGVRAGMEMGVQREQLEIQRQSLEDAKEMARLDQDFRKTMAERLRRFENRRENVRWKREQNRDKKDRAEDRAIREEATALDLRLAEIRSDDNSLATLAQTSLGMAQTEAIEAFGRDLLEMDTAAAERHDAIEGPIEERGVQHPERLRENLSLEKIKEGAKEAVPGRRPLERGIMSSEAVEAQALSYVGEEFQRLGIPFTPRFLDMDKRTDFERLFVEEVADVQAVLELEGFIPSFKKHVFEVREEAKEEVGLSKTKKEKGFWEGLVDSEGLVRRPDRWLWAEEEAEAMEDTGDFVVDGLSRVIRRIQVWEDTMEWMEGRDTLIGDTGKDTVGKLFRYIRDIPKGLDYGTVAKKRLDDPKRRDAMREAVEALATLAKRRRMDAGLPKGVRGRLEKMREEDDSEVQGVKDRLVESLLRRSQTRKEQQPQGGGNQ